MIAFADASALVKFYADESDHAAVRSLPDVVVAEVSRVEVVAALWRKARVGEVTTDEAALLVREFVADYEGTTTEPSRFQVVLTSGTLVREGARLCALHPLRAYDAVQLASALAVVAHGEAVTMVAFDRQLRTAAAREGLALLP